MRSIWLIRKLIISWDFLIDGKPFTLLRHRRGAWEIEGIDRDFECAFEALDYLGELLERESRMSY